MFNKEDYIKYRLERAEESLSDAKHLVSTNHWNSIANRLYYACFYAANAWLLDNDIKVKTHSGARSKFHELLNSLNQSYWEMGKLYSTLFDLRNTGDYLDMINLEKEKIEPLIPKTEDFIRRIKTLINSDEP